ncbi:efflux RND transporter periplasmic adaptor subunit [Shinella sp. CPCC 100929]|jgi:Cu(I)/Ag(I) efflux system membrane fusion protein|uniref:Efflux RND transporter periplasmic adaptor subunit n=1 Tax=Shinella lacus TaxID=2654216 RepID=A0ABT1RDZ7_9HYPH|nr:efflux RND transporter periplasmic adaptor subunit [Shinella lacus]MCQ4633404.1 efflux RND transporter periplasmic adaptor subunit [Shinella lacus]
MRLGRFLFASTVLIAVGAGTYAAGINGIGREHVERFVSASAGSPPVKRQATGKVIYFRHPDGVPEYSAGPKQTSDGRSFLEVRQSEDVNYDDLGGFNDKATAAVNSIRKVLYYRNPMGLPDTSKVPKKDSMGMDYIPVFEGEAVDGGIVKVSPGKLQRTGVRSVEAKLKPISRTIRVPGTVTLDERRVSVVTMRTDAFIEAVSDVTTGDKVQMGEPLFQFYSKDIAAAGAELVFGQDTANKGGALKLRNYGLSTNVIDAMRQSRKVPDRITFETPVSGVILERLATPGMMASAGQPLFRIADTSGIWVVADVPESQLDAVREGAKAIVSVRSLPGKQFVGEVSLVYPELRSETRTAKVRVELANPDGVLLANMLAEVEIESGSPTPVVSVPETAVIDTGDRQIVFVDLGDGRFEPREVKPGLRGNTEIAITDGIKVGERVVVAANFLLDAESNLTSALNAMTAGEVKP